MNLKEVLEKKASLAKRIKEMAAQFEEQGQEWKDATQEENWNQLNADYQENEKLLSKLQNAQQVAQRAAEVAEATGRLPDSEVEYQGGSQALQGQNLEMVRSTALQAAMFAHLGYEHELNAQHQAAVEACGMDLNAYRNGAFIIPLYDTLTLQEVQRRYARGGKGAIFNAPLVTTTPTLGGNIVPPESLLQQVEINMIAEGGLLEVADTMTTETGEPLSWPTIDDVSNSGRRLNQNAPHDDNAGGGTSGDGGPNPAFGKVTWYSWDYTSDTVLVPFRLLRDSVAALPGILGTLLGQRLGRILNLECTTGTGSGASMPDGILNSATLGVTAASATVITPDEVYQLQHSVDPSKRRGGMFMCHDDIALHLRLKKDSEGRYLWQSGFNTGVPDTLAGSRLVYNMDMPGLATTNKTLLYGDITAYKVRRVGEMRFYRLQERYREKDQDGFVAMMSADGGLLTAGTAPVKYLQQG